MVILSASPATIFDFVLRPFALLSLFAIIINVGLIFFIASKGLKVSVNRWFILFVSSVVLWGASEFFSRISNNPTAANFWSSTGAPGWIFVASLFLGFTLTYVGKEEILQGFLNRILIFGFGFLFLFFVWTTNAVVVHDTARFKLVYWGWNGPTGTYFPIFLAWLETQFFTSLVLLYQFYRRAKQPVKTQTLLCVIALLVPLVIGTITDGLLPIFGLDFPGTAILATSVMGIIITYAILKYNLFTFNPATFISNIVATMSEAILVFDKFKIIQFANDAIENFLGYKKESLVGENVRKIFSDEKQWRDFEYHVIGPLTQGDSVKGVETTFVAKNGTKVPVSFSGSSLKDEQNNILAYVGVVADVREIRKLVTDLEAERNKLSVALAGIADGVFVVGKDGKVLIFNKACEEMLGVKFSDIAEKDIDKVIQFYEGDQLLSVRDLFPKKHANKDQVVATKSNVKATGPAGKEVYVDMVSSAIAEGDMVNLGAIITLHDVSKEKELEEMKLDFVSMAAHELRTPLTSIRGYLSVLQEDVGTKLDQEEKAFLDKAFISSNQLAALVENLLSVSRIERGALKVQAEKADWASIVNEVYTNFQNLAEQKNIKLSYSPGKDLLPVMVDKFRIGEVISNLVANALQYTKAYGSVEIITQKEKDGVLTQIKDNGQGIPETAIPKLFTKFFRVSGALEQGSKGTGLGLYISKAIIDMHGGKIWVESELGKGSTFNFIVPFAPKDAPDKEPIAVSTSALILNAKKIQEKQTAASAPGKAVVAKVADPEPSLVIATATEAKEVASAKTVSTKISAPGPAQKPKRKFVIKSK
ncbi:MAG: ATP-binding protein [bacterium]|nr:ATP-binding protein [bacterium]